MTIASKSSVQDSGGQHSALLRSAGFLRSARFRRPLALSVLGVAAVTLAACGGSSAASSTSSTTKPPSHSGSGGSGTGTPRSFPGASGTIAAINGVTLEVQNPTTGQTSVAYTPSTTFEQTVSASVADVTVGSCVSAVGKPTSGSSSNFGGPVTATTVTITQPVSGSCTGGFGGFARAGEARVEQGAEPGAEPGREAGSRVGVRGRPEGAHSVAVSPDSSQSPPAR